MRAQAGARRSDAPSRHTRACAVLGAAAMAGAAVLLARGMWIATAIFFTLTLLMAACIALPYLGLLRWKRHP